MKSGPACAQRFPRLQRLTRPAEYSRVMAGAARSSDQLFTVLSRANSRRCARLGLAISRRAARRAVDRNRIKRLAREAFRQSPHCAGVDIIVFAKQAAATQSRAALRRSLDRHYRRVMNHGASE